MLNCKIVAKTAIILSLTATCFVTYAKQVEINYWSFSKVLDPYIQSFEKDNPDIKVNFTLTSFSAYPQKLVAALRSPKTAPTIFAAEVSYVDRFVEAGIWKPLDGYPEFKDQKKNFFPYVWDTGTNSKGRLVALSWQAAPGGFFYRRDLAKQYLGTDDPMAIAEKTGDFDTLFKTIDDIDAKAGKKLYFAWGPSSLIPIVQSKYHSKLVENNKLVTGPMIHELFDLFIKFGERNAMIYPEDDDSLLKAMEQGNVFGFHSASWLLGTRLMTYRKADAGLWGVASSPYAFIRGGTWLGIANVEKDPAKIEAARKFLAGLMVNVATSEPFIKIRGDFPANRLTYDKVKDITSDYLAGESILQPLSKGIEQVKLYVTPQDQQLVRNVMWDILGQILSHPKDWTVDKAVEAYKKGATEAFPDLIVK